ncbi:hypothetical protein NMG29_06490 [Streptomyces cocklensis]|uniref:DNA-binding phage zinc finger domain-containing protein n=1 Tax=Actinacidiphila cocklensis TaxID=887465 RepID=A0A9W4DML7_9ACTN|nr:hypothetical protein [Actinacidiphila cocklensis]MDD1057879.1 hypothetical protein [Actinacidiphila cocklensis]CAG6392740.1 conserved hypothetical protein [Actinacidiphila cocklensis]
MTRDQIIALLAYAARLDPRTAPTNQAEADDRLDQWRDLLSDVPPTGARGWDAAHIVRQHIASSPYPIIPADIARAWHTHRKDAIGRHTDPAPAADPDNPQLWMTALRADRAAVATGETGPAGHRAALGGRPPLAALTGAIGRGPGYIPPGARQQLAQTLPGRAARETAVATGDPDALTVLCPWCKSGPGAACQRGGRPGAGRAMATPHPSRTEAAHAAVSAQEAS